MVDAFVDKLNLKKLGFDRAEPSATGWPGYQPVLLLKTYVYIYLNRIQLHRATSTSGLRWPNRPGSRLKNFAGFIGEFAFVPGFIECGDYEKIGTAKG